MLFLTSVAGVAFLCWKKDGDVEGVERMEGDRLPKRILNEFHEGNGTLGDL
jgi:hypothetical protein